MGDKMQPNVKRLVLLFGLLAVALATKTAVKVEEKDIGDLAGAALTAGKGLLNPGQLGLMALGTVIKAGTNFFQAMKSSFSDNDNDALKGSFYDEKNNLIVTGLAISYKIISVNMFCPSV